MTPKKQTILAVSFVILVTIILFYLAIIQYKSFSCDIGKNQTLGDYSVNAKFLSKNHPESLDTDCKVRDCLAFNDFQKQINGTGNCIVK